MTCAPAARKPANPSETINVSTSNACSAQRREGCLAKTRQGIEADVNRMGQPAFRVRTGFHGNHEGSLSGGPAPLRVPPR
ncbi:hypothetical protein [Thiolapillus sp.]|uniref:hypothetical protein n=1 Tax=Thiolapillus sp. TaxID=2017437 RepID=UPI003AF823D1